MDTGADQSVEGQTDMSEDALLYPPEDNLSQNNSSAQVTEDVDESKHAYQQLVSVTTVSESSGAETQPNSDTANKPGEGKT